MRKMMCVSAVLASALAIAGCIVSDQLTTLTINPDGSADLVIFSSNVRSTQTGADAEKELAEYKQRFDTRQDPDLVRIEKAGGRVLGASWIRKEVPFANVVHVRLPNAAALEKYASPEPESGEEGAKIATRFDIQGSRRKLAVRITPPRDEQPIPTPSSDAQESRQKLADGISEYRIAVVKGSITAARGFTVAGDKQSALLDLGKIAEILQGQEKGEVELFLEWEVRP